MPLFSRINLAACFKAPAMLARYCSSSSTKIKLVGNKAGNIFSVDLKVKM